MNEPRPVARDRHRADHEDPVRIEPLGDLRAVPPPTRVLIVEDHVMVAESLAAAVEAEPDLTVSITTDTVRTTLEAARADPPSVALIDYRLPDGSGVEAARQIMQVSPSTSVIILTGHITPDLITRAVEAGCVGVLEKNQRLTELLQAVRSAAAGVPIYSKEMIAAAVAQLRSPTTRSVAAITPRELEVLRLLARGKGTDEIADTLYVSRHTVRGYTQRLLARLGAHSKLEAVVIGLRERIITIDDLDEPDT